RAEDRRRPAADPGSPRHLSGLGPGGPVPALRPPAPRYERRHRASPRDVAGPDASGLLRAVRLGARARAREKRRRGGHRGLRRHGRAVRGGPGEVGGAEGGKERRGLGGAGEGGGEAADPGGPRRREAAPAGPGEEEDAKEAELAARVSRPRPPW